MKNVIYGLRPLMLQDMIHQYSLISARPCELTGFMGCGCAVRAVAVRGGNPISK